MTLFKPQDMLSALVQIGRMTMAPTRLGPDAESDGWRPSRPSSKLVRCALWDSFSPSRWIDVQPRSFCREPVRPGSSSRFDPVRRAGAVREGIEDDFLRVDETALQGQSVGAQEATELVTSCYLRLGRFPGMTGQYLAACSFWMHWISGFMNLKGFKEVMTVTVAASSCFPQEGA